MFLILDNVRPGFIFPSPVLGLKLAAAFIYLNALNIFPEEKALVFHQTALFSGFGHMTREVMSLADGKVVLALEGGYDISSICDSAELSVRALLGDEVR